MRSLRCHIVVCSHLVDNGSDIIIYSPSLNVPFQSAADHQGSTAAGLRKQSSSKGSIILIITGYTTL
jgi:hypothetical protein